MNNVLIDDRRIKVDFSQVGTKPGQPGCARNAAAVGTKPGHQGVPICHGCGLGKGSSWPVVHALNSPSAAAPQAGRSCGKQSRLASRLLCPNGICAYCPRCHPQSVSHLWKQFRRFGRKGNADLAAEAEGHQRPAADAGGLAWERVAVASPPAQSLAALFFPAACRFDSQQCALTTTCVHCIDACLIADPSRLPPTGTSGRFEIKDRFLPMGGRGGRGGGYGRGRGGGGYSLVLGDEEEERPRQVGRRGEACRLVARLDLTRHNIEELLLASGGSPAYIYLTATSHSANAATTGRRPT